MRCLKEIRKSNPLKKLNKRTIINNPDKKEFMKIDKEIKIITIEIIKEITIETRIIFIGESNLIIMRKFDFNKEIDLMKLIEIPENINNKKL